MAAASAPSAFLGGYACLVKCDTARAQGGKSTAISASHVVSLSLVNQDLGGELRLHGQNVSPSPSQRRRSHRSVQCSGVKETRGGISGEGFKFTVVRCSTTHYDAMAIKAASGTLSAGLATGPKQARVSSFRNPSNGRTTCRFPSRAWNPMAPSAPQSDSGAAAADSFLVEQLVTLETNIDDTCPQILAFTFEQLLAAGALDVWMVNAVMKKGRPGTVLNVLCTPQEADPLIRIILRETTSLGVRVSPCERVSLPRVMEEAITPWGWIRVKAAYMQGQLVAAHAEYEECAAAARKYGVPLKQVQDAAERAFLDAEARERESMGLS